MILTVRQLCELNVCYALNLSINWSLFKLMHDSYSYLGEGRGKLALDKIHYKVK